MGLGGFSGQISCPVSLFHSKKTQQKPCRKWGPPGTMEHFTAGILLEEIWLSTISNDFFLIFPLGFYLSQRSFLENRFRYPLKPPSTNQPTDLRRRDPLCLHLWIPWDVTWSLYKILNGWIGDRRSAIGWDGKGGEDGVDVGDFGELWKVVHEFLVQHGKLFIVSSFNFQESNCFFFLWGVSIFYG